MRHLGLLRRKCLDRLEAASGTGPQLGGVAEELLLVEIVARTCKQLLRGALRAAVRREQNTSEELIRTLVADFLNHLTGTSASSSGFWTVLLPRAVAQRFGTVALSPTEVLGLQQALAAHLQRVLEALIDMMGVRLTLEATTQLRSSADGFRFTRADCSMIYPRVKSTVRARPCVPACLCARALPWSLALLSARRRLCRGPRISD